MDLIFQRGTENVAVRIIGRTLSFAKIQGHQLLFSSFKGLKLSKSGILKEFPDLADKSDGEMRIIAIERFNAHLKTMQTFKEMTIYIRDELGKHGYKLTYIKRPGHRPQKIKDAYNI